MRLSHKVEIQPTPTQRQAFLQHAGNARWAYNWGLAQHKSAYAAWVKAGKPKGWDWPTAIGLHKELNALKKKSPEEGGVSWMYEASKCAPQEALRNLDRAFKHFFRRCRNGNKRPGFPRFKSRHRGIGGFRLTGVIKADEKTVTLPVIGRVRIKPGDHGYLRFGRYSQVTVTERAGRWFVSIVGPEIEDGAPNGGPSVGIDVGVARLVTLSDGTIVENPRALRSSQRKLRRCHKDLSRKKKGSANRNKARLRLARVFARVANLRSDALHKATTLIAKRYGRCCIEDLKVANMTRSGGSRKRGLNRVVLDASFGEFRRMLEYKGRLYGCEVVAVPAQYTSQRCSVCGHVDAGNRTSQARFCCLSCGFEANADLNAAINILVAGSCPETQNACGEDGPGRAFGPWTASMKQESAAAI